MANTGLFGKLRAGLTKTRAQFGQVFNRELNDAFYDELEEILIAADVGVKTTMDVIAKLQQMAKEQRLRTGEDVRALLKQQLREALGNSGPVTLQSPTVLLIVGVNGVGKTTAIGKLAERYRQEGMSVVLAAGDTFRAAAGEQLAVWAQRAQAHLIQHSEGADPAAVLFDAVHAAKARKADLLICDTAGRLQNKKNLMEELRKMSRVLEREYPEANRETWLVVDANTGQNAVLQAAAFREACDVSGVILTKLDGSAKGGVVVAVSAEQQLPVRFVGVGESLEDLQVFDPEMYVDALFGE